VSGENCAIEESQPDAEWWPPRWGPPELGPRPDRSAPLVVPTADPSKPLYLKFRDRGADQRQWVVDHGRYSVDGTAMSPWFALPYELKRISVNYTDDLFTLRVMAMEIADVARRYRP
jgi:hypothetical protein